MEDRRAYDRPTNRPMDDRRAQRKASLTIRNYLHDMTWKNLNKSQREGNTEALYRNATGGQREKKNFHYGEASLLQNTPLTSFSPSPLSTSSENIPSYVVSTFTCIISKVGEERGIGH